VPELAPKWSAPMIAPPKESEAMIVNAPCRRRWLRGSVGATVLVLCFLAAGCMIFPQLDSLSRTTSEPRRKKVREHAACLAASESQQDLLDCMNARGYQFIKASVDQRAQECYSYLNARTEFPAAYCFEVKGKKTEQ
jgi:hypothetical protein